MRILTESVANTVNEFDPTISVHLEHITLSVPRVAFREYVMHDNLVVGFLVIDIFTGLGNNGDLFTENFTRLIKFSLSETMS